MFAICRHQLNDTIEEVIEQEQIDSLSLDTLEIDLGHIPKHTLEAALLPRLREVLAKKLKALKVNAEPVQDYTLEIISLYLEKGNRHWSVGSNFDPLAVWNLGVKRHWSELLKFLRSSNAQANIVHRLVMTVIGSQEYKVLVRKLRASDAEFVIQYTQDAYQVVSVMNPDQEINLQKSVRRLVLLDLIKSYGSLFNRKMFIKRQLMSLSSAFQISYLEVLHIFEEKYAQIKSRSATSYDLPRLISDLKTESETPPPPRSQPESPGDWEKWLLQVTKRKVPDTEWHKWVHEYPTEFKKSIEKIVATEQKVISLNEPLTDERSNDVIHVLSPKHSKFILGFKAYSVKKHEAKPLIKSGNNAFKKAISQFILLYLLVDRGSLFNQKEFIKYQVLRLSHHYQMSFRSFVKYLIASVSALKTPADKVLIDIIFSLLEGSELPPNPHHFEKWDQQQLLIHYLTKGRVPPAHYTTHDHWMSVVIAELKKLDARTYPAIVRQYQKQIKAVVHLYDDSFFVAFIDVLLQVKVKLESADHALVFQTVLKSLKQNIYPTEYRLYVLSSILDFGDSLQKEHILPYDLDSTPDPHSLVARYFAITLSSEAFYKRSEIATYQVKNKPTKISYQEAYSNIVSLLPDVKSDKAKRSPKLSLIRQSVVKALESPLEIDILFAQLQTSELLLLETTLSTRERQKLIQKLADHVNWFQEVNPLKLSSQQLARLLILAVKNPQKTLHQRDLADLNLTKKQTQSIAKLTAASSPLATIVEYFATASAKGKDQQVQASIVQKELPKVLKSNWMTEKLLERLNIDELYHLEAILKPGLRKEWINKLFAISKHSQEAIAALNLNSNLLSRLLIRLVKASGKPISYKELSKLGLTKRQSQQLLYLYHPSSGSVFKSEDFRHWTIIEHFVKNGTLIQETTPEQLEFLLLRFFNNHHTKLQELFSKISTDDALIEQWAKTLPTNVLIRIIQLYTNVNFNSFMKISSQVEELLERSRFSLTDQFNKKDFIKMRLQLASYYQTMKLSAEQIISYYINHLATSKSKGHLALREELVSKLQAIKTTNRAEETLQKRLIKHFQEVPDVAIEEPQPMASSSDQEVGSHYTKYAGLILFWPFLKRFFETLDCLDAESQFKGHETRARAVRLLHHIASEEPNAPEYEMTLSKIMCGMPFSEHLGLPITLTDQETELSESIINGLIQNWAKLGNTSAGGLRNSFIQREGVIDREERNWIVRVEKKGIDVLLDYLPYTISAIKLPWVEGLIYVEWR